MLEITRVLTQTPDWSPEHAIIFRECPVCIFDTLTTRASVQ